MAARYRSRHSYGGFAPYVPVAARRAKAKKQTDKLRKDGKDIQPIEIEGRTIARSFWGKGWCSHLESFGDYSNRLPRGRTYVRNGSVCHLAISKGKVKAMVSGSGLYNVNVEISPLEKSKWLKIKTKCTGKIGSLIELLQGKLSEEIMSIVTDPASGLYPLTGQITYRCDCPDSARMCKHISAVMYGIGARLDTQPELLFLLRGVHHNELISADLTVEAISGKGSRRSRRRSLSETDLENVFGVELEQTDPVQNKTTTRTKRRPKKPAAHAASKKTKATKPKKQKVFNPTPRTIANLRHRNNMSIEQFAEFAGVSPQTIKNWENKKTKPQAKSLAALSDLHNNPLSAK